MVQDRIQDPIHLRQVNQQSNSYTGLEFSFREKYRAYDETSTERTTMPKVNKALHIVVSEGRWDAYGIPHSYRQRMLFALLKRTGGISDSVPPGHYYYNAKLKGLNLIVTLDPIDE